MALNNKVKNKHALLVFAKAPISGYAKTRLIPELGAEGAAIFHQKLVLHTLNNLVNPEMWDALLWCDGNTDHDFFQQCKTEFDVQLFRQEGDDLGERMYQAAKSCLDHYDAICIVGTDCPVLTKSHIQDAMTELNQADIVFNPAEDGGYVLLAANVIDHRLFEKVCWGSDRVLSQSLDNADNIKLKSTLLTTLWDVDIPDDLIKYNKAFNTH